MPESKMMDIFLVTGFLGAGKTTLIRRLLTSEIEGVGKTAVLVNEVGQLGIDGTLLSGRDVDIIELTSGCICCTMKTDFVRAVLEIHDRVGPDFLLVEATGVAQPGDILDLLFEPDMKEFCRIRGLVTVVDAEFFEARELLGSFYNNQIRSAETLILNKVDLVAPETLQEIEALLREMNPGALIIPTRFCEVNLSLLIGGVSHDPKANFHGLHEHGHVDEMGFQIFSFEEDRPMDREKLIAFLQSLPPTLFRMKGWVKFRDGSAFLDFAAGRYRFEPIDNPRTTALSFVGRNCQQAEILNALKGCLNK
jgi:G3E family GTPase